MSRGKIGKRECLNSEGTKDLHEALVKDGYKIDEDMVIRVLKSEWEKGNAGVTYTAKTLDNLAGVLKVSRDRLNRACLTGENVVERLKKP